MAAILSQPQCVKAIVYTSLASKDDINQAHTLTSYQFKLYEYTSSTFQPQ